MKGFFRHCPDIEIKQGAKLLSSTQVTYKDDHDNLV